LARDNGPVQGGRETRISGRRVIGNPPVRFGRGRAWLVVLTGVVLIPIVGVQLTDRDDQEKAGRSVPAPTLEAGAPNARIIDKEAFIDAEDFDQTDSPLWPLVEELGSAIRRTGFPATEPAQDN
jgi:hypothetical protein